jgi:hypothetical protein
VAGTDEEAMLAMLVLEVGERSRVNRFNSSVVCLPGVGLEFVEEGSDSESAKVGGGHGT